MQVLARKVGIFCALTFKNFDAYCYLSFSTLAYRPCISQTVEIPKKMKQLVTPKMEQEDQSYHVRMVYLQRH